MSERTLTAEDALARIAELEAENRVLRDRAEREPVPVRTSPTSAARHRGRTVLAVLLIGLGCLLAPLSLVSSWAASTLTDTDAFVAAYAPLARDAAVQRYVTDQAVTVINDNVDVAGLTSQVIDGVKGLGTGPQASAALDALKEPAAQGLQSLMRNGVAAFVGSDAFATAWERALRLTHTQLVATMSNDPQAMLTAQADGTIGIQLAPVIADVKAALLDRGIGLASRIPVVDRTIPLAQSNDLPAIQSGYRAAIAVGTWLPWVSLVLVVAGIGVAVRRTTALIWAASAFAFAMGVLLVLLGVGRVLLTTGVPASGVPTDVTTLLFDTATTSMRQSAVAALLLGIAVAVVSWLAGPFATPSRLRAAYRGSVDQLRRAASGHGLSTGRVGSWVTAQRRVLYVLVAIGAAAAILLLRPLTVSVVVTTAVAAMVALVLISLVERPAEPRGPAGADVGYGRAAAG